MHHFSNTAIVRGALIRAIAERQPQLAMVRVASRIARRNYGTFTYEKFDPSIHEISRRYVRTQVDTAITKVSLGSLAVLRGLPGYNAIDGSSKRFLIFTLQLSWIFRTDTTIASKNR